MVHIKLFGPANKTKAQALRSYSEKCKNGTIINSEDVIYYAPLMTNSTKTYTGYGNKRYYEEKLQFSEHSGSKAINTDVWGDYLNTTISAIAEEVIGSAVDSISGGSWTIASLFLGSVPSSVPSTAEITHEANKQETKTKVWTYVVEDSQYYFGCLTEYSKVYFENRVIYNGGSYQGDNTTYNYFQSDDYNEPDERAYYAYTIGGVTEIISSYYYGGVYFDAA
ncbi:MAG: hypothetical protein E7519_14390 [Ruminococcaceae bacterium]|nr:hypothetical protein [Oscillospiraceae bacterium]